MNLENMKNIVLFLSMFILLPLYTQAKTFETEESPFIIEDNYYIVTSVDVNLSADFMFEGNLSLYAGGYLSITAISPLISGGWTINGSYIKFTIRQGVIEGIPSLQRSKLLPIGTAADGKTYYIYMNFVD